MSIAVTGASGQLGRLAIQDMKKRGVTDIVALVRSPEKVADLRVEARVFDYTKPETLAAALTGIDKLVLISSNDFEDRAGQHQNVIDAAVEAGVPHLIYTSILKGDGSPMIISQDHIKTEAAIRASGLNATILRNGWYTENWTGALSAAVEAGAVIGASGEGKVTPAARADYAEAIAAVVSTDGHDGKVYELGGDEAFTMADLASELSRQVGKNVPFNNLPKDAYAGILDSLGFPAGFGTVIADADAHAANGSLFDDSHTLSTLIGRPTTPMAEAVKAAL